MKVFGVVLLFAGVFAEVTFASSFESLKARADAYRDSGQATLDRQKREVAESRRYIPRNNRLILSRAQDLASHPRFGGLSGRVLPRRDIEGRIVQIEFFTKTGFRCRSGERHLSILLCINETTLEQTEALMSLAEG